MRIIIINGFPQSGKSCFEDYCIAANPLYVHKFSTIDPIKTLAKQIGWNGEKTLEARYFLSELKKLTTEFYDYSYKCVEKFIKTERSHLESYDLNPDNLVIFISCREPSEIQKYVDRMGAKTLLIRRPADGAQTLSNKSDKDVLDWKYDYIIENNGTLEDLRKKSQNFINNKEVS